jgi:hypothetical protein
MAFCLWSTWCGLEVVDKRVTNQLLVHIADVPEGLLALTIYEVHEDAMYF